MCVVGAANKKAQSSEGHKEVEESGHLACLGSREGFCAEVKFHLRPEGGGVGEGDFSRRRNSRCPGPEKRAGEVVLEPRAGEWEVMMSEGL